MQANNTVVADKLMHVVVTGVAGGDTTIYVDGALREGVDQGRVSFAWSNFPVQIGAPPGADETFAGTVLFAAFHDRALTAAEVQRHHLQGPPIVVADDDDGDGAPLTGDNCPNDANMNQRDGDGDGVGDVCEP